MILRISLRVGRIEAALRSRSSLMDFGMLPYFSFQEWYVCRVVCCSSGVGWMGDRECQELK